jgi:hypothetical protein
MLTVPAREGIEIVDAAMLEVGGVARDYGEPMMNCRGGKKAVDEGQGLTGGELSPTIADFEGHRQNSNAPLSLSI